MHVFANHFRGDISLEEKILIGIGLVGSLLWVRLEVINITKIEYNDLIDRIEKGVEFEDAQETALYRIIRNGDNIPDDYKKMDPKISEAINELKSCGFTISRHELKNKDSMKKFVVVSVNGKRN